MNGRLLYIHDLPHSAMTTTTGPINTNSSQTPLKATGRLSGDSDGDGDGPAVGKSPRKQRSTTETRRRVSAAVPPAISALFSQLELINQAARYQSSTHNHASSGNQTTIHNNPFAIVSAAATNDYPVTAFTVINDGSSRRGNRGGGGEYATFPLRTSRQASSVTPFLCQSLPVATDSCSASNDTTRAASVTDYDTADESLTGKHGGEYYCKSSAAGRSTADADAHNYFGDCSDESSGIVDFTPHSRDTKHRRRHPRHRHRHYQRRQRSNSNSSSSSDGSNSSNSGGNSSCSGGRQYSADQTLSHQSSFYECFQSTFPEFVRQNSETARRQTLTAKELAVRVALDERNNSGGYRSSAPLDDDDYQLASLEDLDRREAEIIHLLRSINSDISTLNEERDRLMEELREVRSMRSELSSLSSGYTAPISRRSSLNDDYNSEDYNNSGGSVIDDFDGTRRFMQSLCIHSGYHHGGGGGSCSEEESGGATCVKTLTGHVGSVVALDAQRETGWLCSAGEDQTLRLWDLGRWRLMRTLHLQSTQRCCQIVENGGGGGGGDIDGSGGESSLIWAAGDDGCARMWKISALTIHPSLDLLAARNDDKITSDESLASVTFSGDNHSQPVRCLQYDVTTKLLFAGSMDGSVRVWDVRSCGSSSPPASSSSSSSSSSSLYTIVHDDKHRNSPVNALQSHLYALATGGADGVVRLWDLRSSEHRQEFIWERSSNGISAKRQLRYSAVSQCCAVNCLQFDEYNLVAGMADGTTAVWDLRMGRITEGFIVNEQTIAIGETNNEPRLDEMNSGVQSLQFDESRFVVAARGSRQFHPITVIDRRSVSRASCWQQLNGHAGTVRTLRLLNDRLLISGSDDCLIKLWEL